MFVVILRPVWVFGLSHCLRILTEQMHVALFSYSFLNPQTCRMAFQKQALLWTKLLPMNLNATQTDVQNSVGKKVSQVNGSTMLDVAKLKQANVNAQCARTLNFWAASKFDRLANCSGIGECKLEFSTQSERSRCRHFCTLCVCLCVCLNVWLCSSRIFATPCRRSWFSDTVRNWNSFH